MLARIFIMLAIFSGCTMSTRFAIYCDNLCEEEAPDNAVGYCDVTIDVENDRIAIVNGEILCSCLNSDGLYSLYTIPFEECIF